MSAQRDAQGFEHLSEDSSSDDEADSPLRRDGVAKKGQRGGSSHGKWAVVVGFIALAIVGVVAVIWAESDGVVDQDDAGWLDNEHWNNLTSVHLLLGGCSKYRNEPLRKLYGSPRLEDGGLRAGEAICCSSHGKATRWPEGVCTSNGKELHNITNFKTKTYAEAVAVCYFKGMRLCWSQEELDTGCHSGCLFDSALIWVEPPRTTTTAPPTPAPLLGGPTQMLATHVCHMSNSSSSCSLSSLSTDQPTIIYPAGNGTCLHGDPYAFIVYPGDADKLMIFFAGGGACWRSSATGSVNMACFTGIGPTAQGSGIFDPDHMRSPFRPYTIVYVNYCTGDLHLGATAAEWNISGKITPVALNGYWNARTAVTWAKQNMGALGALPLASFVVGGTSAGSIAAQLWAWHLLQMFTYQSAAVFADSYAGVFPEGSEGPLLKAWGGCDALRHLGLPTAAGKCDAEQNCVLEAFGSAIGQFTNVPFCNIQSKHDATQMTFYDFVALSQGTYVSSITPGQLYRDSNTCFEKHQQAAAAGVSSNYVVFYVAGDTHMLTPDPAFFTTTPEGIHGPRGPLLHEWLARFVKRGVGGLPAFGCHGPRLGAAAAALENGTDYCLQSLA